MLAFLLVTLVPAVLLFALVPVVLCGLMLETVTQRAHRSPAPVTNRARSIEDYAGFAVHDACVPSSA